MTKRTIRTKNHVKLNKGLCTGRRALIHTLTQYKSIITLVLSNTFLFFSTKFLFLTIFFYKYVKFLL